MLCPTPTSVLIIGWGWDKVVSFPHPIRWLLGNPPCPEAVLLVLAPWECWAVPPCHPSSHSHWWHEHLDEMLMSWSTPVPKESKRVRGNQVLNCLPPRDRLLRGKNWAMPAHSPGLCGWPTNIKELCGQGVTGVRDKANLHELLHSEVMYTYHFVLRLKYLCREPSSGHLTC